jgi:hypothetical protein
MESFQDNNSENTEIDFNDIYISKLNKIIEYDSSLEIIDKIFSYGTSGFRYNEKELDKVI